MVSAQARREQVDYAVARGVSVRRSCALLQVSRSALGYESRLVARDAELTVALQQISARHPRYGHRFAWALLRRDGLKINRKRVRRVWRALGLQATRRKRRKVRTGRVRVLAPTGPNQVWAYDFVHDRCGNGQTLKVLTVIDEWTRECLAIEVAGSLGARFDDGVWWVDLAPLSNDLFVPQAVGVRGQFSRWRPRSGLLARTKAARSCSTELAA